MTFDSDGHFAMCYQPGVLANKNITSLRCKHRFVRVEKDRVGARRRKKIAKRSHDRNIDLGSWLARRSIRTSHGIIIVT